MNKRVVLLLLVGGCVTEPGDGNPPSDKPPDLPPQAKLGCGVGDLNGVLGEPVWVSASYHGWCEVPGGLPLEEPDLVPCADVPHDLAVDCSGPCDIGARQPGVQALSTLTPVTPRTSDPLTLSVRMTSLEDPADTHTCQSRTFQMLVPDHVAVTCAGGDCTSTYEGGVAVCFKLMAGTQELKTQEQFTIEGATPSTRECVFLHEGHHIVIARHHDLAVTIVLDVTAPVPAM